MQKLGGKHKRGARGSLEEELSIPKRTNMAECHEEEAAKRSDKRRSSERRR